MLITKTQQDPVEWSSSFIVREDKATYTKHDLLFKRLIETFFTEFMEAFFPNLYEKIDFKALKFLSEEMVPVVHDKND